MLKTLLLLSCLSYCFAQTIIALSEAQTGQFRQFSCTTSSNCMACEGSSATRTSDGSWDWSAAINAGVFKACGGGGNNFGYYAGFASITAGVNWSGTSGLASVSGAYGEAVFGVSTICAYEDGDGVSGFQYKLGTKLFCPGTSGADCLVAKSCVDTSDMTFTLTVTSTPCPTTPAYDSSCNVYTIQTIGTWTCPATQCGIILNPPSAVVLNATTYVSNQNVQVGQYQCGPDNAKTQWSIYYPWTILSQYATFTASNCKVTAIGYVGGLSGNVDSTTVWNDNARSWKASNNYETYFGWASSATIDSKSGSTVYMTLNADDVINASGTSTGDLVTDAIILVWVTILKIWAAFHWSCQVMFFSWDVNQPNEIFYDPTFGQQTTSSALGSAPGLMLPLFICIVHYFYRKF